MQLPVTIFDHLIYMLLGRICLGPKPRNGSIFYCDWIIASASSYFITWYLLGFISQFILFQYKGIKVVSTFMHLLIGFVILLIIQGIRFRSLKGTKIALSDSLHFIVTGYRSYRSAVSEITFIRYLLLILVLSYAYFLYKLTSLPPYEYDVLSYHLPLATDIYRENSLIPLFHRYWHFWFPANFELWLSNWMFIGQSSNIALAQFPFVFPLMIFSYSLTRCLGGNRSSGWITSIILAGTPIILFQSVTPMNELFSLPFLIGAILFSLEYVKNQKRHDAILAGCSIGLAIGTKYSFLILIPAIFLAVLAGLNSKTPLAGKRIRLWLSFCVLSLLPVIILSFWYFRNYLLKGNPFYPLEFSIFGTKIFNGISSVFDPKFELNFVPSQVYWLIYPFIERNFSAVEGWGYLVGGIGSVAFLLYSIRGLFRKEDHPESRFLLPLMLIAVFLWWKVSQHEPRFLVYLLPVFAVFTTRAFMNWRIPPKFGVILLLVIFLFVSGKAASVVKYKMRDFADHRRFLSYYALPEIFSEIGTDERIIMFTDCDYGHLLVYPLSGWDLKREVVIVGVSKFSDDSELKKLIEHNLEWIGKFDRIFYFSTSRENRIDLSKILSVQSIGIYTTRGRSGKTVYDRDNKITEYRITNSSTDSPPA
jgi:hypothetical protein